MAVPPRIKQVSAGKPSTKEPTSRKRKAHKKSRSGCRNCKLRRVKCCEGRPSCFQCQSFGVLCNYDASIPDLQPCSTSADCVELGCTTELWVSPLSTTKPVLDMVNEALQLDTINRKWKDTMLRFDTSDLARLAKFQEKTCMSIGVKQVALIFQSEVVPLACTHRFLMHLVQALTECHDRYLDGRSAARAGTTEAYHLNQALVAFQTILRRPVHPDDRDALMMAASLLGVVSFFNLEAETLEDVWPLADDDLAWLNLTDGKKAVWRAASPLKSNSIWHQIHHVFDPIADAEDPGYVPSVFDEFCARYPSPGDPLHRAACSLIDLLADDCNEKNWLTYLNFLCHITPAVKELLADRDPWALLILCYYYMKMCRTKWWISSRAILQGQAICLYLERYHPENATIQGALGWPKSEFVAAQMEGWGGIASSWSRSPSTDTSW